MTPLRDAGHLLGTLFSCSGLGRHPRLAVVLLGDGGWRDSQAFPHVVNVWCGAKPRITVLEASLL